MAQNRRSIQTKETILETASRLFYEKGYTAATIREICSQSGISVSRVNYHFSSKAELAGVICGQFVLSFTQQIREVTGDSQGYSVVVEAIALRFLMRLLLSDPESVPASRFYREITAEGILAETFSPKNRNLFSRVTDNFKALQTQIQPGYTDVYGRIFAAALPPVIDSWDQVLEQCGGDREKSLTMLQNIFVSLFMQMLDFRHDVQQAIMEISEAYYRLMEVELLGLTQVRITMTKSLTEADKQQIMKSIPQDILGV